MKRFVRFQVLPLVVFIFLGFFAVPSPSLHADVVSAVRKGVPMEWVVSSEDFQKKRLSGERFILFDVRDVTFYEQSHIPEAIQPLTPEYYKEEKLFKRGMIKNSPNLQQALDENMKHYDKNTPIIVYCETGCQASAGYVLSLRRMGFRNVKDLEEGYSVWKKKGYPIENWRGK